MISEKTIKALEFDKVRNILASYAVSSGGKKRLRSLLPVESLSEANVLLEETAQADMILYAFCESPDFSFDDISDILEKADKNIMLSMGELLKIARLMKTSRNVNECISNINSDQIDNIKDYASMLYADKLLEDDIYKSILSDSEMADTASSELKRIRDAITRCNINIKNKLNLYTSSGQYSKYLQDSIVTIRNNRYVIPVRSEYRSFIPGLIHDQSASGATVFIEPFQIVQLNNDIATLKISEGYEIEKILKTFTVRISGDVDNIKQNFELLTTLDSIFAKAIYAHRLKAEKPILNNNGVIDIIKGKHPLIAEDKVVPVTIKISEGKQVLLITGPNTGGKTVTLKIVGLFSMMAMCGMFPPCEYGSKIAYFDSIFCDIGDEQSIEQSLSTFSSHLTNIVNITKNCDDNSLVLLDELGAGTDPIEGASLAVAITETLIAKGVTAIITTHYQQMKEFGLTNPKAETASMDFDPVTFAPTYRLLLGVTGGSNAIEIARRLGLNQDIVSRAKSLLTDDKVQFDAIVLSADRARREAEDSLAEAERMKAEIAQDLETIRKDKEYIAEERRKLNDTMRKEAKKILEDYLDEADEAIEKIKNLTTAPTEKDLFEARKLRSKLGKIDYSDETNENIMEYDNSVVKVGDTVYIRSLDKTAVVIAEDKRKGEFTVKMGLITTNIKSSKVNKIVAKPEKKAKPTESKVVLNRPTTVEGVSMECKVIGKRVDEAIDIVDRYIDSAVLAGLKEVRIVHGKGTGALRKAISDYLKTNQSVVSSRIGKYGEGESGVTIVELK